MKAHSTSKAVLKSGLLDKMLVSMIIHLKNKKGQEKPAKHQRKIILLNWKGHKGWGSDEAAENFGLHGRAVLWQTLAKPVGIAPHISQRKINAVNTLLQAYLCIWKKGRKESSFCTAIFKLSFIYLALENGTRIRYIPNDQFYLLIKKLPIDTF